MTPFERQLKCDDISHFVKNKLLHIEMPEHVALDLSDRLRQYIRQKTAVDGPSPREYVLIHKAARMAYELTKDHRLSNLDSDDGMILYDLPLCEQTEWINKILNSCRFKLAQSDWNNILAADAAMKTIDWVMAS